jgi:hypothetical protein
MLASARSGKDVTWRSEPQSRLTCQGRELGVVMGHDKLAPIRDSQRRIECRPHRHGFVQCKHEGRVDEVMVRDEMERTLLEHLIYVCENPRPDLRMKLLAPQV